ncbi:ribosome silencing factor [Frigoriflavimonas asaccharolytica]|uniref:Ribosomal silencing factor RsfS n=1 Tax=Frigoriflavimonas asaccharolytica TaxID=2735899 RepID=A0A8J8KA09_9FLAO|nr:ribosome silencing factor [Frigoriflavimonas asaccharolytica]NRS90979.1 ribosome-associated protein [Frigoriflavimonas asaccharolytica]
MNNNVDKQVLIDQIVSSIQDVKGEDIMIFDLSEIENSVAETFIICTGNSNTQVNAISGSVEKKVRNELGERPWHVEGTENAVWILVDYISVVLHIFQRDVRSFYDLEELWGDAKITVIENQ